jgi:hypothetical protein
MTIVLTTPSVLSKCCLIARKMTLAIKGGTALPICFLIAFPRKIWLKGNDCSVAISRSVKSRSPLGWPFVPPSQVMQVVMPESSHATLLAPRLLAASMSWLAAFRGILDSVLRTLLYGFRPSEGSFEWV